MTDGGYTNVGYFAHTLQLVIHVQIHDSLCIKGVHCWNKRFPQLG